MRHIVLLISVVIGAGSCGGGGVQGPTEFADLILDGGRVITMDEGLPEAESVAIRGDRIFKIGASSEIKAYQGPETEVIDLQGRLLIPGFIESHGHFLGLGQSRLALDLKDIEGWAQLLEIVNEAVADSESGQPIVGRGWHQEKWKDTSEIVVGDYPVHHQLSAISPDNPVVLKHASGHALLANQKAMEVVGIDDQTPNPEGGTILRDSAGRATGVFREKAQSLFEPFYQWDEKEARRQIKVASEECLSKGVTSFQDAGSSADAIRLFESLADARELDLRLWVMLADKSEKLKDLLPDIRQVGRGDGYLTVRAIKRSYDGALGSHGAYLLEPYSDQGHLEGLQTTTTEEMEAAARLAVEHDLQLCVHAIGDRANREILDLFEASSGENNSLKARRWRMEHAQILDASDIPRFAELGVIASMQGVHCTSDGPWVPERIGEDRSEEGAYVWQKLLKSGAVIINGTDAPVEDVDPIANFYASVTRRMSTDDVFYGDQKMTREEALASYTRDAAWAAFEEKEKGRLKEQYYADMVVLSRDILTIPEGEILETRVDLTLVGGTVKYRRSDG